ncbi:MAG: sigma-70 family RNA polymerase sigma factor [Gemmatimonadaceae bacterium]|nr:sigma-70 family RNA polymerase sigma factor [Gemmatimonadaceae bacterium]
MSDSHIGDVDQLIPIVYDRLRALARQRLAAVPGEHSLNTTGLVHEAYLRFVESSGPTFQSRNHFLAIAARVMRNVLVDHVRSRVAAKRGGGAALLELGDQLSITGVDLDRVEDLDEALKRLELLDERQARMIEQRYFGGLSLEEVAGAMDLSLATVKRELRSARAWLAAELKTT